MAEINPPAYIQTGGERASNARRLTQALTPYAGVSTVTDLFVSQHAGTANMSVDISAGGVFIDGSESATQGFYYGYNDAAKTVTVTAANATNPRRDLVVAQVLDSEYGATGSNLWQLAVIAGTPSGSPVDPTVPNNCYVLARIAVAANASTIVNGNITDLRGTNGFRTVRNYMTNGSPATYSGTTWAAIDSTLNISMVVPPSGRIRVQAHIWVYSSGSGNPDAMVGANIGGTTIELGAISFYSAGEIRNCMGANVFTGLTPGTTVTISPQWEVLAGTTTLSMPVRAGVVHGTWFMATPE